MTRQRLRRRIAPASAVWLVATVLIAIALVVAVAPYVWLILTSFKTRKDAFAVPILWAFTPTLSNYRDAFVENDFAQYFLNTVVVASGATIISLLVGTPAAYALARFRLRGRNAFFFYALVTRMLPGIALALPLFLVFSGVGLTGSLIAVVVAHSGYNIGVVIWMMRGFFAGIPVELDEAAILDGHTRWGAFWKVILPLSKSGLVATAVTSFIWSWNEFLYALVLTDSHSRTITVAMASLVTPYGTLWGQIAAAAVVSSLPILVFAFFVQKNLIRGATLGAVKG